MLGYQATVIIFALNSECFRIFKFAREIGKTCVY
jgi:hypothetical protein